MKKSISGHLSYYITVHNNAKRYAQKSPSFCVVLYSLGNFFLLHEIYTNIWHHIHVKKIKYINIQPCNYFQLHELQVNWTMGTALHW